jgi:putative IMPACT (imprinted ancient) family translation regulator
MLLYMIKSSAGNYLKSYQQNGNDTFTAVWTATSANGKVFFAWAEVAEVAAKVGGTILKFELKA